MDPQFIRRLNRSGQSSADETFYKQIAFSRPTTKTQHHMDELERLDEIQSEQNKRKSLDIDAMIEGMFRF